MIAMLEEAEDVLRRAGCDVTADKVRGVLQAQQAEPRCACGDSFTSDAVCANCLAAQQQAAPEAPTVKESLTAEPQAEQATLCASCARADVNCPIYPQQTASCVEHRPSSQQQAAPVAAQCRFEGEEEWSPCTLAHHLLVQAHPKEWPHYETRALYAQPPAAACNHRIEDARNPVVSSGYVCVDCGALFSAADHNEPPAVAVPDGYALVPIEPTPAMLCAGQKEWLESSGSDPSHDIYRAMLDAAQKGGAA